MPTGKMKLRKKIKLLLDDHFFQQKILTKLIKKTDEIDVTYRRIIFILKEYYGVTPKKYYDNLKLEEAPKIDTY
jgi:AraC family transcriptional regulator of adaptative response / methylphosphotriester-DNA alkyltransferase methyltransferase